MSKFSSIIFGTWGTCGPALDTVKEGKDELWVMGIGRTSVPKMAQASLPNGAIGGIFVTGVAYFKRLCASLFLSANIFFLSSWKLTQSSQAICCSMRQVRLEMDDFIIIFHPSLHHNIHIYTYHHNHHYHYHHTVLAFANLGCFSKQTPMNWTMFGCWNLLMIRASIKKSISAEIQLWTNISTFLTNDKYLGLLTTLAVF